MVALAILNFSERDFFLSIPKTKILAHILELRLLKKSSSICIIWVITHYPFHFFAVSVGEIWVVAITHFQNTIWVPRIIHHPLPKFSNYSAIFRWHQFQD